MPCLNFLITCYYFKRVIIVQNNILVWAESVFVGLSGDHDDSARYAQEDGNRCLYDIACTYGLCE